MRILLVAVAVVAVAVVNLVTVSCLVVGGRRRGSTVPLVAFLAFGAAAVVLALPSVAAAAPVDPGDTVAEIRLSAFTVSILLSLVIPLVVGIVTKLNTSATVKGLVNLVLNFVNATVVANTVGDGSAVFTQEIVVTALVGFAISVASYLGLYEKLGINQRLAPTKGL